MGSDPKRSAFPETPQTTFVVNLKYFFAELKRRNVYKVAIVYGVVA